MPKSKKKKAEKKTSDAVKILHRRYVKDDPEAIAQLEEFRKMVEIEVPWDVAPWLSDPKNVEALRSFIDSQRNLEEVKDMLQEILNYVCKIV